MKPHKWGQLQSLALPGKQGSVYFMGSDPGCPLAQLLSLRVGPKPGCPAILTWMEVWGKKPFGEPEGMSDTGKARTLLLGQLVSTLPAFYLAAIWFAPLWIGAIFWVCVWYGADNNDESII